jgi:hypothetical protein
MTPSKTFVYTVTLATLNGPNWTRSFTFAPTLADILATLKLEIKYSVSFSTRRYLKRLIELIDYIPNGSCWAERSTPYGISAVGTTIGTIYRATTEAYRK